MTTGRDEHDDDEGVATVARPEVGTVADRPGALADGSDRAAEEPVGPAAIADQQTRLLGGSGAGPRSAESSMTRAPGSSMTSMHTIATSPLGALEHAEIMRTRNFCYVGGSVALLGAAVIPLLPGGYVTTRIMMIGIGVAITGLLYLLHRTRTPATFRDGIGVTVGWFIPVVAVTTAVPFFGPFSPVGILLVLGIFFTGLGGSLGLALSTYLACALMQGVTGGLVVAGVIEDPGFIHANYLSPTFQLMCQVLVQAVLLATFIIARASRRSSLSALAELEKAVRAVAQREALLEEAREELRRALGSGRGRFTDQTIGNYQLGDIIGRGAMGEVYQGVDSRDGQPVAIKMLAHGSLGNTQHVQRFLRELQTAAQIDSPNVVRVLEVGEHPLPHLVMERLRGRDLAAILRSKRALSHEKVIDLIRQVGTGITAAGAAGIVHRDLKPQNIFLVGSTWKILDFGVSRLAESGDTLTAGQIVGTPSYMAPEQARGGQVDHRTDLYALAAIAYRALTGHTPFAAGEIADTLYRVVHTAPVRPSTHVTLPADVDLVLAIGLAKDPSARFATAGELAEALAAALAGKLSEPVRTRAQALVSEGAWASEGRGRDRPR